MTSVGTISTIGIEVSVILPHQEGLIPGVDDLYPNTLYNWKRKSIPPTALNKILQALIFFGRYSIAANISCPAQQLLPKQFACCRFALQTRHDSVSLITVIKTESCLKHASQLYEDLNNRACCM